ncbi:methylmalonic aciduria and homocystinuria type C protein homolog [Strongylocentrotus purpuratus]|uniref:Cyanocobalamin reductase (cyanide-eliminating) n=1 Tax=Strongylocentrotus purpuratus TaxID=7668 RepID=A0A7M7RCN0_STRPU|nr:methylmalonic aciduria and homocystinuria type C protein homolog [Strongylocentrotus purpuratus]
MESITEKLRNTLEPSGFEIHPFKVGWYNEKVKAVFHLSYPEDTLAFCILSSPSMFDKAFLPFVERLKCQSVIENRDPIDSCVAEQLLRAKEALKPDHEVDIIQDFEMHPVTRRPKLLVQTAGHVSGAAFYYKRDNVCNGPWDAKKKIYGVSIHPRYGGWFAFRGAIIFKDTICSDLRQAAPDQPLTTDEDIIDLLEKFNFHWKDNTFRDVIPAQDKYSPEQICYWNTAPSKRFALLGIEDKVESISSFQDLHENIF